MKASTESEIRADQLRSEIAQLEARYDGSFPPGVYLGRELIKPGSMSASIQKMG